jgi:hypothetical protein
VRRATSAVVAMAALMAVAPPNLERNRAWFCTFTERQVCDAQGCRAAPPVGRTILWPGGNVYSRCSNDLDCDAYPARFSSAGGFLSVEVPGHSVFAKVATDLRVTDVAASGHQKFISRGQCEQKIMVMIQAPAAR